MKHGIRKVPMTSNGSFVCDNTQTESLLSPIIAVSSILLSSSEFEVQLVGLLLLGQIHLLPVPVTL
jgi:hypothetical protein